MYEKELREITEGITPPDHKAYREALKRWDALAKPIGSLGAFEEMISALAALKGSADISLEKPVLTVVCADNGVVSEGVSQSGQEVTLSVMKALSKHESTVSFMAEDTGITVIPVDAGVNLSLQGLREEDEISGLPELLDYDGEGNGRTDKYRILNRRILNGTADILKGPAMSRQDCLKAVLSGISLVRELKEAGADMVLTGEMGIGNTTTSAAVACVLTKEAPELLVGRGAGLPDDKLEKKLWVVKEALRINKPDGRDPIDVIAKVGGPDIAMLTGIFLGGARFGVPAVIDGYISQTAALCAKGISASCLKAMIASHSSAETGGDLLLEHLGKRAVIGAGMRLGEGSGAVMLYMLLKSALNVYNSGHIFERLGIEPYVRYNTT